MKIVFDFTAYIPKATGIDTYMRQLLLALAELDSDNQYLVCLNFEDRRLFAHQLPENFSCRWLSARPRIIRFFFQQVILPFVSWFWRADVVHSPAFIMPFVRGKVGQVLTIHDMTSFSHPDCHNALRRSSLYLSLVQQSMRRADIIIAPSAATQRAIMEFMPDISPARIHQTPLGISSEFCPARPEVAEETLAILDLPKRYVLYVGTLEPRKNISALVESYRRLVEAGMIEEDLVIAGKKGWGYQELLAQIEALALKSRIHLTGYLDQADLPAVYTGARLFVYPSLLEGFGFPPLEAMACGVPAISTRTSSLSENLEGVAELVTPNDIEALCEAMARLLNDDQLWLERQALGLELASRYRWDKTAELTLKSYAASMDYARQRG